MINVLRSICTTNLPFTLLKVFKISNIVLLTFTLVIFVLFLNSNAVVPIKNRLLLLFFQKQHISCEDLPTQPEALSPSHPRRCISAVKTTNVSSLSCSSLGRRSGIIFSFLPMAIRSKRRFSFLSGTISFRDYVGVGSRRRRSSFHQQ